MNDERNEGLQIQKMRYGGFQFGAAFFGWLVANSVSILFIALLSALGSAVAFTMSAGTIGIISGILLLVVLAIAYYTGGYVAGRMARFNGGKQGFGVWAIGIIIATVLALVGLAFGSSFNLLQQMTLPTVPLDDRSFTVWGVIMLLATLAITVFTAIMGGKVGERYHHKVDETGRWTNL